MGPVQLWIERTVSSVPYVRAFMETAWGWPAIESVHFIGLTLLFGSIVLWDLRLLGVARSVPIANFHRLVPFAVLGFVLNVASGSLFLIADADQYVYNPAFHSKLLLLTLAGINILVFYLTMFRRATALGAGAAPHYAKVSGAVSLACWIGVIVCGRLITFYRPTVCMPGQEIAFFADCIIR